MGDKKVDTEVHEEATAKGCSSYSCKANSGSVNQMQKCSGKTMVEQHVSSTVSTNCDLAGGNTVSLKVHLSFGGLGLRPDALPRSLETLSRP